MCSFCGSSSDGAKRLQQNGLKQGKAQQRFNFVCVVAAFMTANLLARAPDLFACGIARSGAYNRTLTPFGFQAEERSLWKAPETYSEMSPFMQADKIKVQMADVWSANTSFITMAMAFCV